jgi:hypothetical protein
MRSCLVCIVRHVDIRGRTRLSLRQSWFTGQARRHLFWHAARCVRLPPHHGMSEVACLVWPQTPHKSGRSAHPPLLLKVVDTFPVLPSPELVPHPRLMAGIWLDVRFWHHGGKGLLLLPAQLLLKQLLERRNVNVLQDVSQVQYNCLKVRRCNHSAFLQLRDQQISGRVVRSSVPRAAGSVLPVSPAGTSRFSGSVLSAGEPRLPWHVWR